MPRPRKRSTAFEIFAFLHPEFVSEIKQLRGYRDEQLATLSDLAPARQRDRTRKLLRCRKLALLYAYEAVRRVQQLPGATPASIRELASRCDPFRLSHEAVYRIEVPSRDRRPIMPIHQRRRVVQNYGPLKRMSQMLVADVIAKLHPPREDQFLYNGGMPKALAAVEAAYRDGFTHAVEVDMSNFYANVRLEGLAELLHPLPVSVVNNVVWDTTSRRGPDDDIVGPSEEGDPSCSGLVGLSLGAATSPIVGEVIICRLLDDTHGLRVVTYADNILVLGQSRAEVVAGAEHLCERAVRQPAGLLQPRIKQPARFEQGDNINFFNPNDACGVEFVRQLGLGSHGRLTWAPSHERQTEHRIAEIFPRLSLSEIAVAEAQVSQWRRSYPFWDDGDAWEAARRAELASARFYRLAEPAHRTAAVHALVIACLVAGPHSMPDEFAPDGATADHRRRRADLIAISRQLLENVVVPQVPG